MSKRTKFLSHFVAVSMLATGCSQSGSTVPNDEDNQDENQVSNVLAGAFPSDLAIASPTHKTGTGRSLRVDGALLQTYPEKRDALAAILAGVTVQDCGFQLDMQGMGGQPSCYGPSLSNQNHPDAQSPDPNAVDDDAQGSFTDSDGDGRLPGGDLGIWRESEANGEACAAATLNSRIAQIEARADGAVFSMASMICLANVAGIALPEDGTTTDLSDVVRAGFQSNQVGFAVTRASLAKSEGSYASELTATQMFQGKTRTLSCRLKHRDGGENGTSYAGKLSCTISADTGMKFGNCNRPEVQTGETDALSIAYEADADQNLTYELRSGNFCGATGVDPWVAETDLTVAPQGWANNFHYGRSQFNITTGLGQHQIAWQAGVNDHYTRVMNVELSEVGGTNEGCAYYGYGSDMATEATRGDVGGMICNWAGPGALSSRSPTPSVQRQCFVFNAAKSLYESDPTRLNISYAPTNRALRAYLATAKTNFSKRLSPDTGVINRILSWAGFGCC